MDHTWTMKYLANEGWWRVYNPEGVGTCHHATRASAQRCVDAKINRFLSLVNAPAPDIVAV